MQGEDRLSDLPNCSACGGNLNPWSLIVRGPNRLLGIKVSSRKVYRPCKDCGRENRVG